MDIKELMVGDLFRVNRDKLCIKKDTIVQVRGIDGDDKLEKYGLFGSAHCHPLDEKQFDGGIWLDYLDPIPLTQEILKKNGFEYYHKNFASTDYDSPFKLEMVEWPDENGNGGLWLIRGLLKIRFVHELQNVIRLCEIDKEIQL